MRIIPELLFISLVISQHLASSQESISTSIPYSAKDRLVNRCKKIYSPVCGSDAKTYSNACVLNRISGMHTQNGLPPIHVNREGECPIIKCICSKKVQPVCATNGETYTNICRYNCERDHRIGHRLPPIDIAHDGPCDQQTCMCTVIIIPVCGTDSVTYRNVCFLECINRVNDAKGLQPIRVHYKGACRSEKCSCPRNYQPLCASDGQTYSSNCTLRCQNRKRHQLGREPLTTLYNGKCKTCICSATFDPVCGSDGKIYSNACVMECENRKRTLAPITVVSKKACSCNCPAQYKPVCAIDGKTYRNICKLGCENQRRRNLRMRQLDVDYPGKCIFSCKQCSHYYAPVCGSDKKTYLNRCWLDCNIYYYNAKNALSLIAYGPC